MLNDFETVQVVDTGVDTVASGQVLDDGTICGFDTLAVANIEEGNLKSYFDILKIPCLCESIYNGVILQDFLHKILKIWD